MSLSYAAILQFKDPDRGVAQVHVQSSKCVYRVIVTTEEVIVKAPGVDEELERDSSLDFEAQAITSVIRFEEGL